MKTSEIRELTTKEIVEKIQVEKENLVRLRLNHAVSAG
jgi:large subunit ribosomal protein L29